MHRRDFIKIASLVVAGCATIRGLQVFSGSKKYLLQPYENLKTKECGILAFNFTQGSVEQVTTQFNVHNIFFDEKMNQFIGVNKYGERYLKFEDISFNQIKYYEVDKSKYALAGHVSSVTDDDSYYLTGQLVQSGKNCILSLNKKTEMCRLVVELSPTNPPAHDCKFANNSDELIFTSSNKLHFLNRHTEKLESKEFALASGESSLRHFSLNSENDICMQSNIIRTDAQDYIYEKGQVMLLSKNGIFASLTESVHEKIKNNELLDFAFDKTGQFFACVHGRSNFLTIWNSSAFVNEKLIQFDEQIVRVSQYFDEPSFLVIGRENFYLVDMQNFSVQKMNLFKGKLSRYFSYSHKTLVSL